MVIHYGLLIVSWTYTSQYFKYTNRLFIFNIIILINSIYFLIYWWQMLRLQHHILCGWTNCYKIKAFLKWSTSSRSVAKFTMTADMIFNVFSSTVYANPHVMLCSATTQANQDRSLIKIRRLAFKKIKTFRNLGFEVLCFFNILKLEPKCTLLW